MPIKVIGAGFGRTGTLSLKLALEEVGCGPCFHMFELAKQRNHLEQWESALNDQTADWHTVFRGYQSTVDFPACVYYAELMEKYPDAKVILTIRESENWYQSAINTILTIRPSLLQLLKVLACYPFSKRARKTYRLAMHNRALIEHKVFGGKISDKAHVIRVYEAHQQSVKNTVPKDRLLVYDVREGWEPLCVFLGVPVPGTPFPSTNDRGDFKKVTRDLFFSF
ncbi:sulfotransferase [Congregibacter brevis]|uniref:Sulfotransferase n=1 Tax=Congregibacter brevis TaxID=3081201 RepID=A0ABZ0IAB3_9GAMM|nr:sulfotransferase [Congregibacter sp. IMCC45268]